MLSIAALEQLPGSLPTGQSHTVSDAGHRRWPPNHCLLAPSTFCRQDHLSNPIHHKSIIEPHFQGGISNTVRASTVPSPLTRAPYFWLRLLELGACSQAASPSMRSSSQDTTFYLTLSRGAQQYRPSPSQIALRVSLPRRLQSRLQIRIFGLLLPQTRLCDRRPEMCLGCC